MPYFTGYVGVVVFCHKELQVGTTFTVVLVRRVRAGNPEDPLLPLRLPWRTLR